MRYEPHTTDDQVAAGAGPRRPGGRPGRPAGLLLPVLPQGLHPAPAVRPPGRPPVPPDRLPRAGAVPQGLVRAAPGRRPGRPGPRPLHPAEGGRPAARKKGADALLAATVARARAGGLTPPRPRAAVDAT